MVALSAATVVLEIEGAVVSLLIRVYSTDSEKVTIDENSPDEVILKAPQPPASFESYETLIKLLPAS